MPLLRPDLMEIISKGGKKKVYPSVHLSQRGQETVVNKPLSDSFNKRFWFCRKITILLSVGVMCSFPGKTWRSCNTVKK